jgi:hypothetical protein
MQATLVLIAAVGSDTNNYQHECTLLDGNQFISYSFLHFNLGLSKAFDKISSCVAGKYW